ncbi:MAG: DEAD/DEAH box helicase [Deltaproteobacteria bacterium]|nr:DEAD/DEAH box helicase [Deltaproteobacteria bacterium]
MASSHTEHVNEERIIAFAELDLPEPVRRGIEDAGFEFCTPIQAETLPLALDGHDIAGQAQTGTGKTAAFLIAAFTLLLRNPRRHKGQESCPRALIIAPTRELAMQIREEAELLGKHTGLTFHAVYGGVDYHKQLDRLRDGVDILIGTPGRLIDYFKQHVFTLRDTEVLIVDEADRMFDMGFIDDLRYLVKRLPPPEERSSFLYSATLSYRVLELAYEHMNNVHRVAIDEEQVTVERVEQMVYHVGVHEKSTVLLTLMAREKPERTLVFVNTKSGARHVALKLERYGYRCGVLMGDLDQKKRIRMLKGFKERDLEVLVATDVASRGLHIDAVTHVFNYDLPQDPEDYVHRIGRTARAGASGKALSLACEHYVYSLEAIEEFIGIRIPHCFPDAELLVAPPMPPRPAVSLLDFDENDLPKNRGPRSGGGGGRGQQRVPPRRGGTVSRERRSSSGSPSSSPEGSAAPRPRRESAQAAPGPQVHTESSAGSAEAAGGDAPQRKRRRRRRGGSGRGGGAAGADGGGGGAPPRGGQE